jgi:hypothetical protein
MAAALNEPIFRDVGDVGLKFMPRDHVRGFVAPSVVVTNDGVFMLPIKQRNTFNATSERRHEFVDEWRT